MELIDDKFIMDMFFLSSIDPASDMAGMIISNNLLLRYEGALLSLFS